VLKAERPGLEVSDDFPELRRFWVAGGWLAGMMGEQQGWSTMPLYLSWVIEREEEK
jgi:hypothetical protein